MICYSINILYICQIETAYLWITKVLEVLNKQNNLIKKAALVVCQKQLLNQSQNALLLYFF